MTCYQMFNFWWSDSYWNPSSFKWWLWERRCWYVYMTYHLERRKNKLFSLHRDFKTPHVEFVMLKIVWADKSQHVSARSQTSRTNEVYFVLIPNRSYSFNLLPRDFFSYYSQETWRTIITPQTIWWQQVLCLQSHVHHFSGYPRILSTCKINPTFIA